MARGMPGFVDHPAAFDAAGLAGVFRALCVAVVDGDTVDLVLDLGFRQYALVTVRLRGVDTPEINGRTQDERVRAAAARDRAAALLLDKACLVRSFKDRQTFGRYVAHIWVLPYDGADPVAGAPATSALDGSAALRIGASDVLWRPLGPILLAEGHAVPLGD